MNKLILYISFLFLFQQGQAFALGKDKQVKGKKNILMIMTDDLSKELFNDLLQHNLIPNIQKHIVDRGVTFNNAFITNPVCCPSRATYLTGQYSKNNGVLDIGTGLMYWLDKKSDSFGGENNTIATWMKKGGYYTGHVGKYLNGYGMNTYEVLKTMLHIPNGYDAWYGLLDPSTYNTFNYMLVERKNSNEKTTAIFYPKTYSTSLKVEQELLFDLFKKSNDVYKVKKPLKYKESPNQVIKENYQTDMLAQKALSFFDNRDNKKPFFLSVMPMAPHIEFREEDLEHTKKLGYKSHFREIIFPAPRHEVQIPFLPSPLVRLVQKASFNEDDVSDKPKFFHDKELLNFSDLMAIENQYRHMMGSMLAVDDMVGEIISRLKNEGIYDETIILFTSDNGYMYGEHRLSTKIFPYDESAKVPLIVAGEKEQGLECDALILNNDLAPTIANLAGVKPDRNVDGRSFKGLLRNVDSNWKRKQFLIEHYIDFESASYINDIPLIGSKFIRRAGERTNMEDYIRMLDLDPNDFKAIRRISDSENHLYIESYKKKLIENRFKQKNINKAFKPEFIEFYNSAVDPFQVDNLVPSKKRKRKEWQKSDIGKRYGDLIDQFVTCRGHECHELEDL